MTALLSEKTLKQKNDELESAIYKLARSKKAAEEIIDLVRERDLLLIKPFSEAIEESATKSN